MSKKVVIYLGSLANTKFGCSPSTVPLEIGYLKAYALSQLSTEVDIRLFRTFESLYSAIKDNVPDIVGCSWYGWNYYLTVNALSYVKVAYPEVMTVVGGANVSEKFENCLEDFRKFSSIDFMIPNEGEVPFVNLIRAFIGNGKDNFLKTHIEGVYHAGYYPDLMTIARPASAQEDINIFPSPYLSGHLDEFLNSDLMPILQTSRGCPFGCSFCVSAKASWKKLRQFDIKRVKDEINYLESIAKNKTIRFTDENFGILPRDVEIAEFIANKRKATGYPSALRVYTHKEINDNIKKITFLLKDLIPMNISTQTLADTVLSNIRRKNLDLAKFQSAVSWAHKLGINVTTEIIFGLPGETLQTFMDGIDKLIELRLDSVVVGTLMMLKETEISNPETIKKYGYKVLYSVAERGYTQFESFENIEIDAWGVSSHTFSFEEYLRVNLFIVIYHLFMFWGYYKEMVYILENRNVKITEVIAEFFDKPSEYPFIYAQIEKLKRCLQDNLFKTEDEVRKFFSNQFSANNSGKSQYISYMSPSILPLILSGEMIYSANQNRMINEVVKASIAVFNKKGCVSYTDFIAEIEFAATLVKNIIIPFWEMPTETVVLSSPYDLISWRMQDYKGKLSNFKLSHPVKYELRINSFGEYDNFVRDNFNKQIFLQSELFFRNFRINNVRRFIFLNDSKD